MLNVLKVRISQGSQYIPDLRGARPAGFRGLPVIAAGACEPSCGACAEACATQAISLGPVRLDLGRCVFCSDCVAACGPGKISFSEEPRMAAAGREALILREGPAAPPAIAVAAELKRLFGRSLKLRSVSAGGCSGCELELNALGNVNFDLGRYGIEFVASPRHADALVISGPITRNMAEALQLAWDGMPAPKFVIAVGACAISGEPFGASTQLDRSFLDRFAPSLYVPGCPPHPLTFINGILDLLGIDLRRTP